MKWKKKTKNFIILLGLVCTSVVFTAYYFIFRNNVSFPNNNNTDKEYLYIPTGSTFEDVVSILKEKRFLKDETSFKLLSKSVGYPGKVLPGKYKLKNKMTNFELVRLLKSGKQEPVKLIIKGSQSMQNFIDYVGENMEITSDALYQKLTDPDVLKSYHLTKQTAPCLIIPNTYEMYWNISMEKFLEKLHLAYEKFWTEKRIQLTKEAGFTKAETVTLASIIEKETDKDADLPIIAGVYINRIAKGMKLQADPTVLFAIGNITSKRVYSNMLDYDSPYNTYKYGGLPPGPICIPAIVSIDAVLNFQKHNFLYFCARADGSGFSDFTESYKEHLLNARKYQHYLDQRNIK